MRYFSTPSTELLLARCWFCTTLSIIPSLPIIPLWVGVRRPSCRVSKRQILQIQVPTYTPELSPLYKEQWFHTALLREHDGKEPLLVKSLVSPEKNRDNFPHLFAPSIFQLRIIFRRKRKFLGLEREILYRLTLVSEVCFLLENRFHLSKHVWKTFILNISANHWCQGQGEPPPHPPKKFTGSSKLQVSKRQQKNYGINVWSIQ